VHDEPEKCVAETLCFQGGLMTFFTSLDENNNPEVIEELRTLLQGFSFTSKMVNKSNVLLI
jgi:hypothetical protein